MAEILRSLLTHLVEVGELWLLEFLHNPQDQVAMVDQVVPVVVYQMFLELQVKIVDQIIIFQVVVEVVQQVLQ
tara:strand:+ start:220 stop:438 length:219 start_codon:yes stop_codon:yes gene_type:complete